MEILSYSQGIMIATLAKEIGIPHAFCNNFRCKIAAPDVAMRQVILSETTKSKNF